MKPEHTWAQSHENNFPRTSRHLNYTIRHATLHERACLKNTFHLKNLLRSWLRRLEATKTLGFVQAKQFKLHPKIYQHHSLKRSKNRTRLNSSGSNPFCTSELQCKSARIRLKRLYNATWKQHHVVTSGNAPQLKESATDSANSSQCIARGNSEIQNHSKRCRMPISSSSKLLHSGNPSPSRW